MATVNGDRVVTITDTSGRPIAGASCRLNGSITRTSDSAGRVAPVAQMPAGSQYVIDITRRRIPAVPVSRCAYAGDSALLQPIQGQPLRLVGIGVNPARRTASTAPRRLEATAVSGPYVVEIGNYAGWACTWIVWVRGASSASWALTWDEMGDSPDAVEFDSAFDASDTVQIVEPTSTAPTLSHTPQQTAPRTRRIHSHAKSDPRPPHAKLHLAVRLRRARHAPSAPRSAPPSPPLNNSSRPANDHRAQHHHHAGQTFELSLDYAGTPGRGQRMHIRASDARRRTSSPS